MKSLQDQLLKAGLVDEKKIRQAQADKNKLRKKAAKAPKAKRQARPVESPEVRKAREEKRARDRALNLERQRNRERNARMALVRDFVAAHICNDAKGEIPYHVNAGRKIKRVYVTSEQHRKLQSGELITVVVEGKPRIIPGALEERIRAIDPDARIIGPQQAKDSTTDDDYAGFEVPDDLMW